MKITTSLLSALFATAIISGCSDSLSPDDDAGTTASIDTTLLYTRIVNDVLQVVQSDADGTNATQILNDKGLICAPANNWITCAETDGSKAVFTAQLAGGNATLPVNLTTVSFEEYPDFIDGSSISRSPNGAYFTVSMGSTFQPEKRQSFIVNTSGEKVKLSRASQYEALTAFSPDGSELAMFDTDSSLVAMSVDASRVRTIITGSPRVIPRVYNDRLSGLTWSPDGRYLAYVSEPDATVYMVSSNDRSHPVKAAEGFTPAFSPDGTKLAIAAMDGSIEIREVDAAAAGGQNVVARLERSGSYCVMPQWSPDGRRIVCKVLGDIEENPVFELGAIAVFDVEAGTSTLFATNVFNVFWMQ